MSILITGSTGLLGRALVDTNCGTIYTLSRKLTGTDNHIVHDLTRPLPKYLDIQPDLIVHCAAEGNVDAVENDQTTGLDQIIRATANVIAFARRCNGRLVYISSNAVFDGRHAPYDDDAELRPINAYGRFKAAAEIMVQTMMEETNGGYLIIRPMLLYGHHDPAERSNIVTTIINRLQNGHPVKAATDVIAQPMLNTDCAKQIWQACNRYRNTAVNVAGPESMSIFEMATAIGDVVGNRDLISPCSISEVATAPRPADTSFSLRKAAAISHQAKTLREGVQTLFNRGSNEANCKSEEVL